MDTLLLGIPILSGLNAAALKLLSSEAQEASFVPGAFIVREGESGSRMFLIHSGRVRVIKCCGTPSETELALLGPGEFFGEGCILNTLPRVASVQATEPTRVFGLANMTFYHLYRQMPDQYSILLLNIARDLSRRLRHLDEQFAACH